MSKGRDHAAASLGLGLVSIFYSESWWDLPFYIFGSLISLFITPDLDQGNSYYGGRIIRNFSPILYWIWMKYWWLYSRLIPHRSWISHAPLLGTVLRVLYITWPLLIISPELFLRIFWSKSFWQLVYCDIVHWAMDFYDPDI